MQQIYDVASQRSVVVLRDAPYMYQAGKPSTKLLTTVNDGDRYYKITTRFIIDEEQEDGSIKYRDIQDTDKYKYVCTWIFDKTGEDVYRIHPSRVARRSNNVYKPFNIVEDQPKLFLRDDFGKFIQSAKPLIGYNKKFDKTEHNVVCYDLNSAYATVLIDKIIDTYNCQGSGVVGKGCVGFMLDCDLTMKHEGEYADFIFPLIDSPYRDYAIKYYKQKESSPKGSKERDEAKQVLVITVGLFQNVNPFLRAYVVNSCNEFIGKLVNKYKSKVCMWNTDAIYTTEHIQELDELCGEGIGQFKVEYEGLFRQVKCNYQKVEENKTSYRGVMKMLFKEDYNILTDQIPKVVLPYKMNKETYRIELNKEFNNGKKI